MVRTIIEVGFVRKFLAVSKLSKVALEAKISDRTHLTYRYKMFLCFQQQQNLIVIFSVPKCQRLGHAQYWLRFPSPIFLWNVD